MLQRPFYLISHRCNTLQEVQKALENGANAVECDFIDRNDRNKPWIAHDKGETGTSLEEYLKGLKVFLDEYPQFALLIFDCKTNKSNLASQLLEQTRTHLTKDTDFNIIISVGLLSNTDFFRSIHSKLKEREGLAIDAELSPLKVSKYFQELNLNGENYCYANGYWKEDYKRISKVRCNMIDSVFNKAFYRFKFVYVWTINDETSMRDYLRIGVDGIFVDVGNESDLKNILREKEFEKSICLAGRDVNPFPFPLVQSSLPNFEGNITGKPITNLKVEALEKPEPEPKEGWNFYSPDLAIGTGSKYFIYIGYKTGASSPVTSIKFLRSNAERSNPPAGWEWDETNLNAGVDQAKKEKGYSEKSDYVYLCWKKEEDKPPIADLFFLVTEVNQQPNIQDWDSENVDLNSNAGSDTPYIWPYYKRLPKS